MLYNKTSLHNMYTYYVLCSTVFTLGESVIHEKTLHVRSGPHKPLFGNKTSGNTKP